MRTAAFVAALVAGVAAAPQAVTSAIAPKESTPAGCKTDYDGKFQVTVNPVDSKKSKRDSVPLEVNLKGGVLTDALGRTGYIASNNQFQFDGPAQAGAIFTAGWSVCGNGSLALGDSAVFYQCLSGTFYNLYDEKTAAQCSPVYLQALPSAASPANNAAATNTIICQIGDGQIQQNTCVTTATRVAEATDGQLTAVKATITQIGDGQIQAPGPSSAASVTTAPKPQTPVVQPPKITQISDGQIQVPTGGNTTVATRTPTPVGNSPVTSASGTSPAASTFTGGASVRGVEMAALVAGLVAIVAL